MIIFNHEIDFYFFNFWQLKDDEDDFQFQFRPFDILIARYFIGISILNFGFSVHWYN